jgi:predicted site-specific integrase-resolvase
MCARVSFTKQKKKMGNNQKDQKTEMNHKNDEACYPE